MTAAFLGSPQVVEQDPPGSNPVAKTEKQVGVTSVALPLNYCFIYI